MTTSTKDAKSLLAVRIGDEPLVPSDAQGRGPGAMVAAALERLAALKRPRAPVLQPPRTGYERGRYSLFWYMRHGAAGMSVLLKKKEAFAQGVAAGATLADAYRKTRDTSKMQPATVRANAKKIAREPAVKARIEELRRQGESSRESSDAKSGAFGAAKGLTSQEKRGGQGGEGGRTSQAPRIHHLDSLGGVVREMATIYREVRTGKTEPDIGCKLVYILKEVRAALEANVLERLELRLTAIEGGRLGDESRQRAIPPPH